MTVPELTQNLQAAVAVVVGCGTVAMATAQWFKGFMALIGKEDVQIWIMRTISTSVQIVLSVLAFWMLDTDFRVAICAVIVGVFAPGLIHDVLTRLRTPASKIVRRTQPELGGAVGVGDIPEGWPQTPERSDVI